MRFLSILSEECARLPATQIMPANAKSTKQHQTIQLEGVEEMGRLGENGEKEMEETEETNRGQTDKIYCLK